MYYPSICFILITNSTLCAYVREREKERDLYSFANSSMSKWISSSFRCDTNMTKHPSYFSVSFELDDGVACSAKTYQFNGAEFLFFFHSYHLIIMRLIKIKLNQYPSMAIDVQSVAWAHTLNCKWERFIWPKSSGLNEWTNGRCR